MTIGGDWSVPVASEAETIIEAMAADMATSVTANAAAATRPTGEPSHVAAAISSEIGTMSPRSSACTVMVVSP